MLFKCGSLGEISISLSLQGQHPKSTDFLWVFHTFSGRAAVLCSSTSCSRDGRGATVGTVGRARTDCRAADRGWSCLHAVEIPKNPGVWCCKPKGKAGCIPNIIGKLASTMKKNVGESGEIRPT